MTDRTLFSGSCTTVVAEYPLPDHPTELTPEPSAQESWSELRVVVVEDSTIVRERLIRLLTAVGNVKVVGEAISAQDAIKKIADLHPDFVTLDLRLEGGSGLDVLRAMQDADPRPCVAVLTNYGDTQSRRECLAMGADFFFDKSLELGDLRTILIHLATSARDGTPWRDHKPD